MPKKDAKIGIAVVGLGYWGPNLVRNFFKLEGTEVKTVCDIDRRKLTEVKKNYPTIHATENFEEILRNKDIRAVCIALPTKLHYQFAKKALEVGKDVLIEKPFTSKLKEAQELVGIAKANKRILMADHTFIYTGSVRKIKELVDRGSLGNIYYFDSERVNLGLLRTDTNVIWDLAVHDISIIYYLFKKKPVSVSAVGSSHILKQKEEMAHITLEHEGGIISHIHVSWLSPVKLRKILVGGDRKMVLYDDVEPTEKVKIYDKGIDIDPEEVTPSKPLYRGGDIFIPKLEQTEPLEKVCSHFVECVKSRKKPLTDGESAVEIVKILETSDRSIQNKGKRISLQ